MSDQTPAAKKSTPAWVSLLWIAGMMGIVALPIYFIFIAPSMRHDRLVKEGVRAQGRLLAVDETGTYINDSPELELVVEVKRESGELDTVTTDFLPTLRSLSFFQPGAIVTAAYDREDPDELTIIDLTNAPVQVVTTTTSTTTSSAVDSLARVADSLRRELESMRSK